MNDTSILLDNWDYRFLALARHIASWSKDPSRKLGAVAIGQNRQILATGYNGFPRGIDDDKERYNVREIKYKYVVHAEMNCIYNATENGVSLQDATVYVHGLPVCSECAKGLIQVGVERVVAFSKGTPEQWKESNILTTQLFEESGIHYDFAEV